MAEEIPWNNQCVDHIGPYKIGRKGKDELILKVFTMIDPKTGWYEVTQYGNKKSMTIVNLVRNYVSGLVPMASRDHV